MFRVGAALGAALPCRDHTLHSGQQQPQGTQLKELLGALCQLWDTTVSSRQN